MKVRIKNLGALHDAQFDLKPLTVFIGMNGVGKTWVAYTLLGLFSVHGWRQTYRAIRDQQFQTPLDIKLHSILDEINQTGACKVDLTMFFDTHFQDYLDTLTQIAPSWIGQFIGSRSSKPFEQATVKIEVSPTELAQCRQRISQSVLEDAIGLSPQDEREAGLRAIKQSESVELYFSSGSSYKNLSPKLIRNFVIGSITKILHKIIFDDVIPFPIERTSLLNSTFIKTVRAGRIRRHDENDERETGGVMPTPGAIGLFMGMIIQLLEKGEFDSQLTLWNTPSELRTPFTELAHFLETRILGGSVAVEEGNVPDSKEISFTFNQQKIELAVATSMVKELAGLVFYLRYFAVENDLIIIDEPEMNLHPKAQAEFIEFLALLVQHGIRVLITTHSTFMVDHLSNLVRAAKTTPTTAQEFFLQRPDAFIPEDQVGVFLFEEGGARSLLDNGYIDWSTYAPVSDRIADIGYMLHKEENTANAIPEQP
jgi:hypothetical protein